MSAISEVDSERMNLEIFEAFEDDEKRLIDKAFQAFTSAVTLLLNRILPRNPVNGNREFRIYSLNQEIIKGNKIFANVKSANGGEVNHPETELCQKILSEVTAHSKRNFEYEVIVLNTDIVNAYCAPGGKIGITKGFLEKTEHYVKEKIGKDLMGCVDPETGKTISYEGVTKEDVIAALIGHEMIHADARHGMARLELSLTGLGSFLTVGILSHSVGLFIPIACLCYFVVILSPFFKLAQIRNQELEADKLGMINARKAGYNPIGALLFQEVLKGDKPRERGILLDLLQTHPPCEERQRLLFQEINAGALRV